MLVFDFAQGATGIWDASRYHESLASNPRYTFGTFLIEGARGAIRLDEAGELTVHLLGQAPRAHAYVHEDRGFAGDCCFEALRHFVSCLQSGDPFATAGRDYLRTLAVQEAVYRSAASGLAVPVGAATVPASD